MEYLLIAYQDLNEQASELDIEYDILYKRLRDAADFGGNLVYFRRYTSWSWMVIDQSLPVDWVMALILA